MKPMDWVLIAAIAVAAFFAVRYIHRAHKRGEHIGCSGNCAGCTGCPAPREKEKERP